MGFEARKTYGTNHLVQTDCFLLNLRNYVGIILLFYVITIGGAKGGVPVTRALPRGSKFFHFHAVFDSIRLTGWGECSSWCHLFGMYK